MTTFKVGEVAIMCNCIYATHLNGTECTITQPLDHYNLVIYGGIPFYGYLVTGQDGQSYAVRPDQLRKKHPPSSDDAAARQVMLDCIERAKQPVAVDA